MQNGTLHSALLFFSIKDYPIQPFIVHSYLWGAILGEVVAEGATLNTGHGRGGLTAEVVVYLGGGVQMGKALLVAARDVAYREGAAYQCPHTLAHGKGGVVCFEQAGLLFGKPASLAGVEGGQGLGIELVVVYGGIYIDGVGQLHADEAAAAALVVQ